MRTKLSQYVCVLALVLAAGSSAAPVHARGGANIGHVVGDLRGLFDGVANPTVPPRTLELENRFNPPEFVPGLGATPNWSPAQVDVRPPTPPAPPAPPTTGDGPWLTPIFNGASRQ